MSQTSKSIQLPIVDHTPKPYDGPTRDEVLALRHQYVSPGVLTYYRDPLMVVEGHMQYLWDETGRRYLDAFAGVVTVSVGHCHPKVIEKVQEQNGRLQHTTTIYLHPTIAQFAEKLASKMPETLSRSYFTNSGSEAAKCPGDRHASEEPAIGTPGQATLDRRRAWDRADAGCRTGN